MPLRHTAATVAATNPHRKLTLAKQGAQAREGHQVSRLGPGLPLLQGLRVLHNGAADLKGWRVVAKKGLKQLLPIGTVQQVDNIQAEGQGPTYHLLCVVQQTELQPYGFKGQEVHLLPLVPDIVTMLHPQQQLLVTAPPEGLLDLGRRDLLLSFLAQELLPYAPPAQGRTAAAAALAGVEGAGGRALTQPRLMPSRSALIAAGRSDLVGLILKVGGFTQAALQLGLQATRRPVGYWDSVEVLDAELDAFIAGCWVALPCPDEEEEPVEHTPQDQQQQQQPTPPQQQQQQPSVVEQDSVYFYNTATKAIRWSLPHPELFAATAADAGPASEEGTAAAAAAPAAGDGAAAAAAAGGVGGVMSRPLYQALLDLQEERVMPPSSAITAAGRWDLHHAIVRHGGYTAVAAELDRRPCRALPHHLTTTQGLKVALQDVCRQEGWDLEVIPSAQQLRDIDRSDLIRALSQLGGWRSAAVTLGLSLKRPTPTTWHTWTLTDLAQQLAHFMAQHGPDQPTKPPVQNPATASTTAAAVRGANPAQAEGTSAADGTPAVPTARSIRLLRAVGQQRRQAGQQQQQQRQQWQHLPTQAQLVSAGRFDLLYALKHHGYEAVRQHMGLQGRYSRAKQKGVLQWSAVEAAVTAGCHSCRDILQHISTQHWQQQQQQQQQQNTQANTSAGPTQPLPTPQKGPLHAAAHTSHDTAGKQGGVSLDIQGTRQGTQPAAAAAAAGDSASAAAAAAVVPVVSREHLQRQLRVWLDEGRLVKTARNCFKLPHQCL